MDSVTFISLNNADADSDAASKMFRQYSHILRQLLVTCCCSRQHLEVLLIA
jgi:hypothetical protein